MEDPYELALAMFGLALTAVMLVAGALYLISTPSPEPTFPAPVPGTVTANEFCIRRRDLRA